MSKLSIIVPGFNIEYYLDRCLESIRIQTLKDIEIICIDDGSTDKTLDIFNKYKLLDSRFIVIHKENGGLGAARNLGLIHASGEYIGFVDGDDFIHQEMFEKLVNKAEKTQADIVIGGVHFLYKNFRTRRLFQRLTDYRILEREGFFTANDHPGILQNNVAWNRIYKRSLIIDNDLKFPENRIYEDVLFSFKSSLIAKRISVVPEIMYFYRQDREGSILSNKNFNYKYAEDFLKNFDELKNFMIKEGFYENEFKEIFLEFQLYNLLTQLYNLRKYKDFVCFCEAFNKLLDADDYDEIKKLKMCDGLLSNYQKKIKVKSIYKNIKYKKYIIAYFKIRLRTLINYENGELRIRIIHSNKFLKFRLPWTAIQESMYENHYDKNSY
ncbi:MAG: glycosyltransferase [Anaerorhabdus sp.]|uniref:glycosyltransferase family 2 protein n=1 Tax=Anaerorhabdus sp. TaxID=1872524 RepID=UPI002FCA6C18